ncbi:amidase [Mycobacterium sp. BK086]|nr:amidase [Mycobacterium sp. BK086]
MAPPRREGPIAVQGAGSSGKPGKSRPLRITIAGMADLCHLPAHELVRLMTTGAVSCREVLDAHLARIDAVNPGLNALVAAADPKALRRSADEADQRVARGEPVGRAHGLPVVVKDVMLVSGLVCSGGSPALQAVADRDATVVSRLRVEGAIVLGMTNVPEMGRGGESNNNLYGRTNNPFDPARTPGGSSGGSAALISAGGAALSVGSDGGGSIRQPSHNCGIAGLKPTHGRIPRTGSVFGDAPGIFSPFNCYGPLARSVADLALGLSIMSGPDLGDPYAAAAPVDDPGDVDVASLRVAAYLVDGISEPEAQVAAVVTAAAQAIADSGAAVRWDQPDCLDRTIELLWKSVFLGGDRGQGFEADLVAIGATDPSEELAEFLRQARDVEFTLTEARNRLVDIDTFRLDMLAFMADYDVIIGPAMPGPAKPHHHGLVEISDFSHLMAHNLTGWPAVVVRCGTSPEGLPIGVQIAARPWQDATALAVAAHLEAALGGWRPPP